MADDTVSSQPADSGASLKKKGGKRNMMIIAAVVVIVLALVAVVVLGGFLNPEEEYDNALDRIQSKGKIVVGTQVPYAPFETINATTEKLEGIDIEIMEYVAAKLNVTIVWRTMDFDPLFVAVQTGQLDCAISSVTITEERDVANDFSEPYFLANQAILVRESSTITTIDDLNGTDIVTQTGTTGQMWVDDNVDFDTHTFLTDVPAAAAGVENENYDVFVVDTPVAKQYAEDDAYHLKVAFIVETLESYGILLPNDEPELKAAIDQAIIDMIEDGTLHEILVKWDMAI
ncbi:MAG: cystine transporter subunit [Methanomassiliicoccales archaeon PtaB.Bin215]|nr:MAG: cystine transporter subunit [Methanomassiliicoccales archaeon PtaB.Bin215]